MPDRWSKTAGWIARRSDGHRAAQIAGRRAGWSQWLSSRTAVPMLLIAATTACIAGCGSRSATPVRAIVFVQTDCPVSNRFVPELNAIAADYGPRGVEMVLVYPDPSETEEVVRRHVSEYHLVPRFELDPDHRWVDRYQATVTPEVVVEGPEGRVRYRGRINDQVVDFGQSRREPRRHDLRLALDAVLAGKEPEIAKTEAVGCLIADLQQ